MSEFDVIEVTLPATHKYLSVLSVVLGEMLARVDGLAEPDVTTYNLQLAVQEACANIVDHAYAGGEADRIRVVLTLVEDPRRLLVDLHDSGQSFDPAQVAVPDLDHAQVHGYGLFLMHELLDEVQYQAAPGDNHWHLVKAL